MNKLSKVLVFLFILFSFIACVFKKPISRSHTYYIINETDKHIFAQADYQEKKLPVTKTISIQGKTDEPVFLFTKADLIPACFSCDYPVSPEQYSEIWFYNIADTSSVKFTDIRYDLEENEQLWNSIYQDGCRDLEEDAVNVYFYRCIHITDEFLDIFEKDYSMLEKFTEYYP
jgi:hypothetical protein